MTECSVPGARSALRFLRLKKILMWTVPVAGLCRHFRNLHSTLFVPAIQSDLPPETHTIQAN
jgi:hypothetical protein